MLDPSTFIGTAGALVGVGLGGWLTGRSQRAVLKESHHQMAIAARESAYSDFLAAHRQFRRFLQTEPVEVRLVPRTSGRSSVPVIAQAATYWEAVENATARLAIIVGDRIPDEAWRGVVDAFYDIARARASCQPGGVPDEIISSARAAELRFAQAAREELTSSGAIARSKS